MDGNSEIRHASQERVCVLTGDVIETLSATVKSCGLMDENLQHAAIAERREARAPLRHMRDLLREGRP
jgi:hypothetical protein